MYRELFDKINASDELKAKIEERIDASMKNKKGFSLKITLLAACLVLVLSVGAVAAYRYLTAGQAAREMGDKKLAISFDGGEEMNITAEESPYRATLLGVCSGENLSDFGSSDEEIAPERTYAVLAIERTDGTEVSLDDGLMVSPLVQGLDPMRFSVFSMGGSSTRRVVDGIMYWIVECDSIECLADRQMYMAVYDGLAPNTAYSMDAETGEISPKAEYDKVNMLLKFRLDPSKADPDKAQALIDRAGERVEGNDGGEDGDGGGDAGEFRLVVGDPRMVVTDDGVEEEKVYIIEEK